MYHKFRTAVNILKKEGLNRLAKEIWKYSENKINSRFVKNTGQNAIRDRFEDIQQLCEIEDPIVVDGGAHKGQTIQSFRQIFKNPTVHSFEANSSLYNRLAEVYGDETSVEIHNCALGSEESTVEFNINHDAATSSVLRSSKITFLSMVKKWRQKKLWKWNRYDLTITLMILQILSNLTFRDMNFKR